MLCAVKISRERARSPDGSCSSAAAILSALAATMRGARDLPRAPHDETALADQKSIDVFRAFIGAEESMLALLQENVREHRAMLSAIESS